MVVSRQRGSVEPAAGAYLVELATDGEEKCSDVADIKYTRKVCPNKHISIGTFWSYVSLSTTTEHTERGDPERDSTRASTLKTV